MLDIGKVLDFVARELPVGSGSLGSDCRHTKIEPSEQAETSGVRAAFQSAD
jgi:hypothetical protein